MSSDQAPMESGGGPHREHIPGVSAKKLWRVLRAVYLVLVKGLGKHQPKLAALGVHLHQLLSKRHHHDGHHGLAAHVWENPALTYLSTTLSCRSMDPATAVVHPYSRGGAHAGTGHRGGTTGGASGLSSLSCRSMDPAAAVYQYQYRPREVEFSCSSTPLHKRRRAQRRLRLQHGAGGHDRPAEEYCSAAAVTRQFEMMDFKEAAEETDGDDDGDLAESAVPWAPVVGAAPRQVRITDSPFPAREEDDQEKGRGVVDRRADEFIMWFHKQLRMQQQRAAASERSNYYWVR